MILFPIISPNLTGTAFPMYFPNLLISTGEVAGMNLYFLGNVCKIAPSRIDIALFCWGCPNRPVPKLKNCVVIVGAGLSHSILA